MAKKIACFILFMLWYSFAQAGVRQPSAGGGQMVAKLQAMMRQVTKERDSFKVENAKLKAELDKLTKQNTKLEAKGEKISQKLAGQQGSNRKLQARQQQTYNKLVEVIDKYKLLKQEKNQLKLALAESQGQYKNSNQQLELCSVHNGKLIVAANELLERYENKGTFDGFLQAESVLQFKSVEMEAIVQKYQDKIRDEKYHSTVSLNNK